MAKGKDVKNYTWTGRDKQGRERSGTMQAPNEMVLKAYISKQGITQLTVKEVAKPLYESKGRIKSKDVLFFTRQMATMLRAGMPVLRSLQLVADSIDKPIIMREMVQDIHTAIENGASFAEALGQHSRYFDALYTGLVAAGEEAGVLEDTMDRIAVNLEKGEATKKKIKKALQYPIIVMVFAVIVTAILLIKVVPTFASFFIENGGRLPAFTQMVVDMSDFMIHKGIFLLIAFIVFIMAFMYLKRNNKSFNRQVNIISFKLPIFGGVLKCGANARFARTLSTLFGSGVPMIQGLEATAPATGSVIYERAILEMREDVANGQQLSFAMRNTTLFPTVAIQMTAIGEESGNLGDMLGRVASFYEEELDWRIDGLTTMIEPLIMAFLAVVVGGLVIAMYLPIFNMGSLF